MVIEKLKEDKLNYLEKLATRIRKKIIEILLEAGSGHVAGSLGMVDILVALYFHVLNHNPKAPKMG